MSEQYLTLQERKQRKIKIITTVLSVVLVLGLSVWAIVYLSGQDTGTKYLTPGVSDIAADEYIWGKREAKATLLEYGDFQCPACKVYSPWIEQLHQDFPDQLRIVFRHFPLPQHKNAPTSSYAAEAAGLQGKFWEMYEILYSNQETWASAVDPQPLFESYAGALGLNVEQFIQDYHSDAIKNKVRSNQQAAAGIGINSTPTFYLNGQKISTPQSYDQFKQLVLQASQ